MSFCSFTLTCVAFLTAATAAVSAAPPELPVRDKASLPQPLKEEGAFGLATAKPVAVDYELLRADFPELAGNTESEVDRWLEARTVIASAQAAQTEFNTAISTQEFAFQAYRPRSYGRGLVVDVGNGAGFLDEKGAGSDRPRYDWEDGDPRNGNMTLGEAIREALYSEVVSRILADAGLNVEIVRVYAVMSAGFDVIHRNSQRQETGRSPAGLLIRQAHSRFENPSALELADRGKYFLWNQEKSLAIERVLRRYGITSVGSGRPLGAVEGGINIQGTPGNAILDFGNYVAMSWFPNQPVFHFYGERPLLIPGSDDFPQPDPLKSLPTETWGSFVDGMVDSKSDKPWVYAHETAAAIADRFRHGQYYWGRDIYGRHRETMLKPFFQKLNVPFVRTSSGPGWGARGCLQRLLRQIF